MAVNVGCTTFRIYMVVELGAAFVLLVAGGCARAVAQPLWRRFVHWWHTEGNEPAEFRFMDRLVESMAAKRLPRVEKAGDDMAAWREKYAGTKNAGKVPIYGATRVFGKPCPEFDEMSRHIEETSSSIEERIERLREAEEALIRARLEE